MGLRKEVVLAVRGGGASIPRPTVGTSPLVRGCFTCGDRGHVQRFCPRGVPRTLTGGIVGRCWGCGGFGHRQLDCPGRSLPVMGPNGPMPGRLGGGGGVKCAGGPLGGAPAGRGGALRGGVYWGIWGLPCPGRRCPSGCALGCCPRSGMWMWVIRSGEIWRERGKVACG